MNASSKKTMMTRLLSIEDGRLIFQALSELPFKYVFELIGRMNRVANGDDPVIRNGTIYYAYTFSPGEMELIVQALGPMPYSKVFQVIQNLQKRPPHDTQS